MKKKYRFLPTKNEEIKEGKKVVSKPTPKPIVKTEEKPLNDPRLDKLMPLLVDILSRLLGSAGMLRYRTDFIEKVKEIMDEKR